MQCSALEPRGYARHLLAVGEVDLQWRDRYVLTLDGVEVRALARRTMTTLPEARDVAASLAGRVAARSTASMTA